MDSCGDDEIIFQCKDIGQYNPCLPDSIRVSGIHRAVLQGQLRNVKHCIESGESVNKTEVQCNFSPLHLAVIRNDSEIIDYLLARDDIEQDLRCSNGKTPLNTAATLNCMESMVNGVMNSPFVKDIIERGADVNYFDKSECLATLSAFSASLVGSVDACTFKLVWERLRYNHAKNTIDLLCLLDYRDLVPTYLQVIIESDNFEPAVEFFSNGENLFVDKFAEGEFELEQITVLTCRLLQYRHCVISHDICMIFSHYGYCELFRILLYMDVDCTRGWRPCMVLPRLIFDIDYAVDEINDIPRENIAQLLEYSTCAHLINGLTVKYSDDEDMRAILGRLPRVPSLIELARDAVRKHIRLSLKIANTCQFYTALNYLNVSSTCKDILTFQRKINSVKPSR